MAANIPEPLMLRYSNLAPAGPLVAMYEWHCRGHVADGPEEVSGDDEIVVPSWGAFVREAEGRTALGDPGSGVFFHRGESYRVRHPTTGGDGGTVFRLAPGSLAELLPPGRRGRPATRFPVNRLPLDGRAWVLHRLARRAALEPGTPPLEREERALLFVQVVAQAAVRGASRSKATPTRVRSRFALEYAARVAEVVSLRYRERLTLAEVGAAVGCSPFHLSRLVAAAGGVSIHRMIVRRRLQDAVDLLLDTGQSISAIALTVGFASHSHLTDAFRREYGVPPSVVRRVREWRRRTDSRPWWT